ncbi:MAG: excinuclease ABC subunit UvrC [Clostridiales bacterium]|nr:excinuclease ABC subunit UvrC [Clostridiales bacterium]
MFDIKENLKKLPTQPGVYIMKDKNDTILYVGKAINLKNRVSQYFRKTNKTLRIEKMVSKIAYFEYIITDTEVEALILECNLIKKHKPQYNVMLKDDKSYPYIKVTMKETFPRVYITRKKVADGSKYYGPYTDVYAVHEMLDHIKSIFPIRNCNKNVEYSEKNRPCLNFHIKKCLAPCSGNVSEEDYRLMIKKVCSILEGNYDEIISSLTREMNDYSKNLMYEKAAEARDKIANIKKMSEKQKVTGYGNKNIDVIGTSKIDKKIYVSVLSIKNGKLLNNEKYKFDDIGDEEESDILLDFIKQFYSVRTDIPSQILIRYEIEDLELLENWLSEKSGDKVKIKVVKKGENDSLLKMAEKNAVDLIKKSSTNQNENIIIKMYEELHLKKIPAKIESYDISNMGNDNMVGAMVSVVDGKLRPDLYRKFKIKENYSQDDISCTYEIVKRRLKRVGTQDNSFGTLPDLILADGGRNQVNVIKKALKEEGFDDVEVIGMVKDNKHKIKAVYVKDKNIPISKHQELLMFLFEIQEEVHRVAITYHRELSSSKLNESWLDTIDGIGEIKKKELLKHFGNIEKIKNAEICELMQVKGITEKIAQKIKEAK